MKFKDIIRSAPERKPLRLVVGHSNDPEDPKGPVRNIHPAFVNRDRVAYLRREELKHMGYSASDGDSWQGLVTLQEQFGQPFIVSSSVEMSESHISIQTKFMRDLLLEESRKENLGVVTDATYSFFKNGFLIASSVYSLTLKRWAPVILTWSHGLKKEHYKAHFITLIKSILSEIQGEEYQDMFLASVVDFSMAQRQGFILAYVECRLKPGETDTAYLEARAMALLKGCLEHFRASITRISRNKNLIGVGQEQIFKEKCMELITLLEEEEFLCKSKDLIQKFPKISRWIQWWSQKSVAEMIFQCYRPLNNIDDLLPQTTNAEEAFHAVLYQIAESKNSLLMGINLLHLKSCYDDAKVGIKISYGEQERWKKLAERLGTTKKYKAKTSTNDGRPPDTTLSLLQSPKKTKIKPGRKQGGTNTQKHPLISYKSYSHFENTCYVTSLMESLYTVYLDTYSINGFDWHSTTKGSFYQLVHHFDIRKRRETDSDCKSLSSCLTFGRKAMCLLEKKRELIN
jgi:hypothetical protein